MTGSPPLSILLVEDNPGDARLVEIVLETVDMDLSGLVVAENLETALDHIRETMPDLVLLDLTLPDSHGIETVRKIRAAAAALPIIVLTGYDDENTALEALRAGAQDYMIKGTPDGEVLRRAIRYAIERQRFETELAARFSYERTLIDAVPVPLAVKDADGLYLSCNEAFQELLGLPTDRIIGHNVENLLTDDLAAAMRRLDADLIASGGRGSYETHLSWPDGRNKDVIIQKAVFQDQEGVIGGIVATVTDVTEIKRQQQQVLENEQRLKATIATLRESREQLSVQKRNMERLASSYALEKEKAQAADRAKSEFLATMSHEIRTPIAGVIGTADLLLAMPMDREARSYVETIRASASNLLSLLNDILDLSKLDAGKLEIVTVDFDLPELIEDVARLLKPTMDQKDLLLEIRLSPEVPRGIHSDPARIRQVLFNLLGNAIKFTHDGGVTIAVSPSAWEGEDIAGLRFAVTDTGIGIDDAHLKRLFQRFTQADSTTSRRYGGSGLGLSISKHLARLLGGEIGVESKTGEGSTFWFTVACHPARSAPVRRRQMSDNALFKARRPLSVLIAEDNRVNQTLLRIMLMRAGHQVTMADDGAEAVAALKDKSFDLVLMDIRMPEVDGVEATRAIRALPGDKGKVPVIGITADAMLEHRDYYLSAGMNECVVKPIDWPALFGAIDSALDESLHEIIYATPGTPVPDMAIPAAPTPPFPSRETVLEQDSDVAAFLDRLSQAAGNADNGDPT